MSEKKETSGLGLSGSNLFGNTAVPNKIDTTVLPSRVFANMLEMVYFMKTMILEDSTYKSNANLRENLVSFTKYVIDSVEIYSDSVNRARALFDIEEFFEPQSELQRTKPCRKILDSINSVFGTEHTTARLVTLIMAVKWEDERRQLALLVFILSYDNSEDVMDVIDDHTRFLLGKLSGDDRLYKNITCRELTQAFKSQLPQEGNLETITSLIDGPHRLRSYPNNQNYRT